MQLREDISTGGQIAFLGGAIGVVGAFLPWVTVGVTAGPLTVEQSSTGIDGLGIVSLVAAVLALAVVLVLKSARIRQVAMIVLGAVIAGVAVWKYLELGGAARPGIGLYLTVIGGIAVAVGGVVERPGG